MLYFILAGVVVLLDQLFKYWISLNIALGETMTFIPNVLSLTHIQNDGAAFSILAGNRWLLVVIMCIGVIVLATFLIKYRMGTLGRVALALVLGGALGNLVDRIVLGYVVDMFETEFVNFAIFNIADCFITVGGLIFIVYYIVYNTNLSKRTQLRHEQQKAALKADDELIAKQWTETEILEEYHIEQISSEEDTSDNNA